MSGVIENILNKLKKCDDFHDRCDCLLEHDEITYLLDYIQQKENIIKEVEKFVEEVLSSTKGVINDYMYHKEHNKERIELLREDIVMYKHILEILDKGE